MTHRRQRFLLVVLLALVLPLRVALAVDIPRQEPQVAPEEPQFQARAAMVVNMEDGSVLFAHNADEAVPPASLAKIMSLYVAFDAVQKGIFSLVDSVPVSKRADATGGSSMGIVTGRAYPLWQILKGMAVASGNDACVALAEFYPGGFDAFVARMNAVAKELGMYDSGFANPHGLNAPTQLVTARDMLILAEAYLRRFPQALRLHSMPFAWYGGAKLRNRNKLLGQFPGADGLKTGYVNASGYNLVATARRDGVRILAVVLGAPSPKVRTAEATRLLEAGFERNHVELLPGSLETAAK